MGAVCVKALSYSKSGLYTQIKGFCLFTHEIFSGSVEAITGGVVELAILGSGEEFEMTGSVEEFAGLQTYITGPRDSNRAILLLSDAAGLEIPNFRKLADKVAEGGFFVVAPDFFYGDPIRNLQTDRVAWMKAHDAVKGCEDAKAVIEALKNMGVTAIGAAGFCWGGMVAVKLAKYDDLVKAVVILHPGPNNDFVVMFPIVYLII